MRVIVAATLACAVPVLGWAAEPSGNELALGVVIQTAPSIRVETVGDRLRPAFLAAATAQGISEPQAERAFRRLLLPVLRARQLELSSRLAAILASDLTGPELLALARGTRDEAGRSAEQKRGRIEAEFGQAGLAWGQEVVRQVLAEQGDAIAHGAYDANKGMPK